MLRDKLTDAAASDCSAHLLRVDYEDGTGFWVHCHGAPIAGTKNKMDTLATTVSWAGGTVRVVRAAGEPRRTPDL